MRDTAGVEWQLREQAFSLEYYGRVNRRDFLKHSAAGVTAAGLLSELSATAETAPLGDQPRYQLSLNRNWLFGGKAVPGSSAPGFDDSGFERVTIPHANKLLPWHSFDEKEYQYVSIYRRHFRLPKELDGKRIFVDFAGVMTAATVTINGSKLGEYRGGYTPFSFELSKHLRWDGDNVLAVEVDSTERADIPPFGQNIDYLTFGGIYREVTLRAVGDVSIQNILAKPVNVLQDSRRVDVRCYLNSASGSLSGPMKLSVEIAEGGDWTFYTPYSTTGGRSRGKVLASTSVDVPNFQDTYRATLTNLGSLELWDLDHPKLYHVTAKLLEGDKVVDEMSTRIGFREARFTHEGFMLNGQHIKLRGLNRHQTYPYVGSAVPARCQRSDAVILKKQLKCNIVRTSHYPQSTHFLDACDELGLLVFEEIPGWQHIGDQAWQDLAVRNVGEMIRRDWNHPSIVLWGVRINESQDNHDFYTRTNALAHELDDSRQTGGVRYLVHSELLEDVYTRNDFGFPLIEPNYPIYLNTEFNGHMFPTKRYDNVDRVMEHARRHARVHNQLASDSRYCGGIGWCAFDYNTHANFGSGDRICYHGVSDIFRIPKPAGQFYRSQCDPKEEIVLEPTFNWSLGDQSEGPGVHNAVIVSNCDHLKIYLGAELLAAIDPDRKTWPHLPHPPFQTSLLSPSLEAWADLKMEGYINGRLVVTKTLPGNDLDRVLHVTPDDLELEGDGIDATRVVLELTNDRGGPRPFSSAAIALRIEGPGEIIGENPLALSGGAGAVWIKSKQAAGTIRLHATHPRLGTTTVEIAVKASAPELV